MKYAIKIPFGNPEDRNSWIYVTDAHSENFDDVQVKIYNSLESAQKAARIWRLHEVVEYSENNQE